MNAEMFIPIYGTALMLEQTDDPGMPFRQKAALAAMTGAASVVPTIALGEIVGFTAMQVRAMQFIASAATSPMTYTIAAPLILMTGHQVAKKELQKEVGYSANKFSYTTPFSSGFGTVV